MSWYYRDGSNLMVHAKCKLTAPECKCPVLVDDEREAEHLQTNRENNRE